MSYRIDYDEESMKFVMDGVSEDFVSAHLMKIANLHNIEEAKNACSESHLLSIILSHGVEVEFEQDW